MLFFVYGMLGVAVIIALMGIANTLSLSIHDRRRELGLLRAVGQDRRQLRSTVRWESVIIALFGTIGGIGLGSFLGWGLVRALEAQEGFGTFALPVAPLAVVLGLAAGGRSRRRPAARPAGRQDRHPRRHRRRLARMTCSVNVSRNSSLNPLRPWRHPLRLWLAAMYNVTALPVAAVTFTV